jgi:hypothetical protein
MMNRMGYVVLGCLLWACSGNNERTGSTGSAGDDKSAFAFANRFQTAALPYQLTDTALLRNSDTTSLPAQTISPLLPDTLKEQVFGKTTGIKFTPLVKLPSKDGKEYFIIKGTAGSRKAALLMVFDDEGTYGATLPFLVADAKSTTSQSTLLDKSYVVTKSTTLREEGEIAGEGREVLAYDAAENRFSLIMTDLLSDDPAVLINPIDTFPKTHRLAGDYFLNKKNLVSVRDGRYNNQILVYIHTEKSGGDCKGQLKGEFILTSSTTAVYRQGGDPCILGLTFSGNSVSINEERGCGNYRELDCPFAGKFTRKKEENRDQTTEMTQRP